VEVYGCQNNVSPGLYVSPSFNLKAIRSQSPFVSIHIHRHPIFLKRGHRHINARICFFIHLGICYILRKVTPSYGNPILRSIDLSFSQVNEFRSQKISIIYLCVLLAKIISREREQSSINGFAGNLMTTENSKLPVV